MQDGLLLVRFNEAMLQDENIRQIENYRIELQPGARAMVITDVIISSSQTDAAILLFTGGLGLYTLTVKEVFDANGNPIDLGCNRVNFTIDRPLEDDARIHLFDTVFGPMGMTQRSVLRRTVDTLVVNRSIDHAMHEQLSQRLKSIGASSPLRSGKDGGRRR